jgi:hypothetical protein
VVRARKGWKRRDSEMLARAWIFRRGIDFWSYGYAFSGKGEGDFEAAAIDIVEKMEESRVGDSER